MAEELQPNLPTFDGINWTLLPSLLRALRFAKRANPELIILQWWSASALPAYLALARFARRRGIPIVIEFHETLDTAEANLPLIGGVIRRGLSRLIVQASAFVVHSHFDFEEMTSILKLPEHQTVIIPLGAFPMAQSETPAPPVDPTTCTILFFGTIRPYKGLEFLVEAFDLLPRNEVKWKLVIVGETWEGWTTPFDRINESANRSSIEVVNRYVIDSEIPAYFTAASLVALPYLRSSASGPLHLAMGAGLPVVVSDVGGLAEAAHGYRGAIFVEPGSPQHLADGLVAALDLVGEHFVDPRSWDETLVRYNGVINQIFNNTHS